MLLVASLVVSFLLIEQREALVHKETALRNELLHCELQQQQVGLCSDVALELSCLHALHALTSAHNACEFILAQMIDSLRTWQHVAECASLKENTFDRLLHNCWS